MRGNSLYLGWQLFLRDFHARYRRAGLAILWILSPMLAIVAMSSLVAANMLGDEASPGVPYPVFAATGLLLWGLFAEAVVGPQQMCRRARSILKRVPLRPAALLVANTIYLGMNFAIKLVPTAALFAWYGVMPAPTAWLALPFALGLIAFGYAIGMLLAPVSMVYQDIRHGLSMAIAGLLIATPILYSVPAEGLRHLLASLNPIAWLLVPARDAIFRGNQIAQLPLSEALLMTAPLLFIAAYLYFRTAIKVGIAHL